LVDDISSEDAPRVFLVALRATIQLQKGPPRGQRHIPFYEGINRILDQAGFGAHVEKLCAPFYAEQMGRPSLTPGRYFRLLVAATFVYVFPSPCAHCSEDV
jgi:hypothetical protein